MSLDPNVEAQILDTIGTTQATDEDLETCYLRTNSVAGAALSILRRRRASLGPDSWSLSGDYAQTDGGRTAAWLDREISRLEAVLGLPSSQMSTVRTSGLARYGPSR